jgi:Protein of unknown function (DUF1592)/Protein of unknown function (DUF1588)/Protein of unknown function (DUF1585)/Protein of unknown function (DUF1587)/Protein of unknown function (DUF1595)/Planctomycete cytochrome C
VTRNCVVQCIAIISVVISSARADVPGKPAASPQRALLDRYCVGCHNEKLKSGGLALDTLNDANLAENPAAWEKVVTKLRAGLMPPARLPRPDQKAYDDFRMWVQTGLDRVAATHPDPGRTEVFHRLNRTEYQNSIRDLLALNVKAADLLPADDSSNGFDNMAGTLRISQSLMERYLSAAKTISRMAIGSALPAVDSKSYRVAPDMQQHDRVEGLPFGTRGGILINYLFPRDADYEFKIDLAGAQRIYETHQLEISIDGEQIKVFTLEPKKAVARVNMYDVDGKTSVRVHVKGGPHDVAVTFFRKPADMVEQVREPFPNPRISGNDGGPGGPLPDVAGVTIRGPYDDKGPGDTPSRHQIFVCHPSDASKEAACAKTILAKLAHRAYRGPVRDEDLQVLLSFYNNARKDGEDFEAGIELALRRLLVSPEFLFRIEADPAITARTIPAANGTPFVYRISDLELASRLSFFLWSSIPDEELLKVAENGSLRDRAVLEKQVHRMLTDPRSETLTTNFAGQWLELRNMDTKKPGDPYSLAYDETLRRGLQRETELFFDSVVRENRPTMELLTAKYTFLNQRVAEHYGIPNIQGSDFRRVELAEESPRRGLLGQGSILTITSHPNRTSPVLRGKWILKNILGTPPPDPPPNVPSLPDQKTQAKVTTLRERMAQHRANEPCATCHSMIDPAGFALENFDAIGRWRIVDESYNPIDTSGALPDGTKFSGVTELRTALALHPERFVNTVAQKLMTYALGRGLEYYDMPAVRKIVKDTSTDQYRVQSLVLGIVESYPFQMRRADPGQAEKPGSVADLHNSSVESIRRQRQ